MKLNILFIVGGLILIVTSSNIFRIYLAKIHLLENKIYLKYKNKRRFDSVIVGFVLFILASLLRFGFRGPIADFNKFASEKIYVRSGNLILGIILLLIGLYYSLFIGNYNGL